MRRAALATLLFAPLALAHVISFSLELPAFVGNHPGDGGLYTLQWVDLAAAGPQATISLWATRAAYGPFEAPDAALLISADVPYASPVNVLDWDTTDAGEGCWQPYAVIDDPIEGHSVSKGEGRITVWHGANQPPAIWVTTPKTAVPGADSRLTLDWDVDEPDDDSRVDIGWVSTDGERGAVVSGLPLRAGTRTASYTFDVHRLPPKPVALRVEISSGDAGSRCDAWWGGFVTGEAPPDAGPTTADAGLEPGPRGGCGCHTAPFGLSLCALAWLSARRKSRVDLREVRSTSV